MAYVEVWKSGRLITRRRVDEQKAQKGCRIRLGSAGEVRVAIGQLETLGKFEVRMFAGEPPIAPQEVDKRAPRLPQKYQAHPPLDFSVGTPVHRTDMISGYPDIEGYKIIERLGEGGMGTVWRAEQLSTRREVALKLMASPRFDSQKVQARFEREVELTARLDHPNIARIYDSGLHRGMYYYAMEFINGLPLDQYVENKALPKGRILALMRTVCQAVEHAHLRGVIHRDLKPSNIMVGPDGQPHVVDFGLARTFLDEDEALNISIEGEVAGTPAYMSPEQAAGRHDKIDTRTDVYSLGVMLYRLLTGRSPYSLSGSMFDVLQRIVQGKIRRPQQVTKSIDRELDALLLKALALNPDERYSSAGALEDDINNYLDGEPLNAQVPTTLYFLRKKARKYRVQVAIGAVVLIVIFGTALAVYTQVVGERIRREAVEQEVQIKVREAKLAGEKAEWAELELKVLGKNQEEARAALRVLRDEYFAAQKNANQLQQRIDQQIAPVRTKRIGLRPGQPTAPTALVRQPALPKGVQSWTLETLGHRGSIRKVAYSPNGRWLASSSPGGTVRLWDSESGQLTKILVDPNGSIVDLAWSVDSKNLFGIDSADSSRRWVWDPELGKVQLVSDTPTIEKIRQDANSFSWSSEGDMPARTINDIINLWDIDLPGKGRSFQRTATAFALSPDRSTLAFGDSDGSIHLLYLKSGRLTTVCTPSWCGSVYSVAFSTDGEILATCTGGGTVCLWDAHRWQPLRKFQAGAITSDSSSGTSVFAWSPDGTNVAIRAGEQNVVAVMDSQSGKVVRTFEGNAEPLTCIAWAPDGRLLAAGTFGGTVLLWDLESESSQPKVLVEPTDSPGNVITITWSSDSHSLITAGEDGIIRLWDPNDGILSRSFRNHRGSVACLALSPDGQVLASASRDQTIRLWDIQSGRALRILRDRSNNSKVDSNTFSAVTWSPDGITLASGNSAGNIHIWDLESGKILHSFNAYCGVINSLTWSPDGQVLVCGGADGTARAWDVKNTYKEYLVLLPLWGSVGPGIAINPEGDYRGPPGIADYLVYVVETEVSQKILSPQLFANQYGWVNEPWQVGLYKPGAEKVERIYVNAASSEGPYDGKSWATAFHDLQDALSIAQPNTEIWVAAGIYTPDRGTGARTASFHLRNNVRTLGGFAGTETSSHQRSPNKNVTILSGDIKGNDGPGFANNDENSYHVVTASRTYPNTVLDGFIITGGNADGLIGSWHLDGGGIYSTADGLTLINCTFRFNSAGEHGGGMWHKSNRSNLSLTNCIFSNNRATSQRGHGWGGGVVINGAKGTMNNCTFDGNLANDGGGAFLSKTAGLILQDCTFIGNRAAKNSGGGIRSYTENTYSLLNCRFVGNSARNEGGGVFNSGESNATLTNCIFVGNSSRQGGGGMSNWPDKHGPSHTRLTNCTFIANSSGVMPGGFRDFGECISTLTNCILWFNTDRDGSSESAQVHGERTIVNHCRIQGWTGKLGGTGNLGDEPLFVDFDGPDNVIGTDDDNLRLKPGSPCINAGDNAALPTDKLDLDSDGDPNEPIPFDFEGKPRILNGTVDIGAYESG